MKNNLKNLAIISILVFTAQNCASTGNTLGTIASTHSYNKSFEVINNYFLQSIRGTSIMIDDVSESETEKFYIISTREYIEGHYTRTSEGKVYIRAVSPAKTVVKVENPEYPFAYPEYKKVDYQEIIFEGLADLLEKNS